jgi:hypothetical protein
MAVHDGGAEPVQSAEAIIMREREKERERERERERSKQENGYYSQH